MLSDLHTSFLSAADPLNGFLPYYHQLNDLQLQIDLLIDKKARDDQESMRHYIALKIKTQTGRKSELLTP